VEWIADRGAADEVDRNRRLGPDAVERKRLRYKKFKR